MFETESGTTSNYIVCHDLSIILLHRSSRQRVTKNPRSAFTGVGCGQWDGHWNRRATSYNCIHIHIHIYIYNNYIYIYIHITLQCCRLVGKGLTVV